jgi:hypothetical protein
MRFTFFSITALLIMVEPGLLFANAPFANAPLVDAPRDLIRIADGAQTPDAAPQKAVLYEQDSANPNGVQHDGAVVWHMEQVPSSPGQASDVVIRADIEIPAQGMSVSISLRRNGDPQIPASHLIDVTLTLPPDFSHGGVRNIPGILLQPSETVRGMALNGVAVKVTNDHFMVGLSSRDADMARNVQLLKEQSWLVIPMAYTDGKRALIVVEKGTPGESAFSEAFAAWEQQDRARPGR